MGGPLILQTAGVLNASHRIDFQGSRVTSDGGLILVRELDERLGFGELIEEHLKDSRRGNNT
ncbi:MAG TPA: transposase, partial [Terriglobia bacterium]|nr:transposase [Terriglobia bacterium]